MSLEAYVQSGLDNEWISSWKAASLRAGAVAYRSYGAYYVKHPVKSNFDIASTTCNQAWGSETATTTINAAKATAGVVLIKSGAIFRSEYSAENNNAGCGNGYSGTGSAWPCISDARCAGRAKNGHGRGMCQWGSSFWASDKTYTWILNHYYNPGGVTVQAAATVAASLAKTSALEMDEKETMVTGSGNLTLFPNPVAGDVVKVGYSSSSAKARTAILILSDNAGTVIQRKPVQLQHGYNQFTLNIGALKNGIYIIAIQSDLTIVPQGKKLVVAK
jgi:hypothetical protein